MEGFEVMHRNDGDIAVLQLKGFLDAHTAPTLESALQNCIDEKEYEIMVDCQD